MSTAGSVVELIYDVGGPDELDITNHAVVASATFNVSSNANTGDAEITLRDLDRTLTFVTGRRLKLRIDGQDMWSGFTLVHGRGSFFAAGDGKTETLARQWTLHGVDNNILLDKRFLRRPANYLTAIPKITTDTLDGVLLRLALSDYFDMPAWVDIVTFVDDIQVPSGVGIDTVKPWAWMQQGTALRETIDDLARFSAAVYYIGPDDAVHYHAVQDVECPWGFSDRPNKLPLSDVGGYPGAFIANGSAYWGFREMDAEEDGQQLATDAFVWGGSEFAGDGTTVFKRATDAALEAIHGKWQLSETHFDETNYKLQKGVDLRANMIVFGNPDGTAGGAEPGTVVGEGPRGLRFSQWQYRFKWWTRDVPSVGSVPRHLYPGDIVPIQLWAFSEDGGTTPFVKFLPLRALSMSFTAAVGGKAHVQFGGTFDLRNEDSKFLWKFLRTREKQIIAIQNATGVVPVTGSSTSAPNGGFGQFSTDEATPGIAPPPDGSTTVFHTQITTGNLGYIANTTQLWADTGAGLTLRQRGTFYTESDPDTGEITLADATGVTSIQIFCRTQLG